MQGIKAGRFSAIRSKNIVLKQPLEAIWWRIPPAPPYSLKNWPLTRNGERSFFYVFPSENALF
jgi:hypothetical protein